MKGFLIGALVTIFILVMAWLITNCLIWISDSFGSAGIVWTLSSLLVLIGGVIGWGMNR